jgi:hypothetical protein
MNRKVFAILAFSLAGPAYTQDANSPYPKMAPLAQYLMTDQNAEVALARSAAPASISGDATILVLKPHGYETVEKGRNGFVCMVERAWMSPFDSPEFWNPKNRSPTCFNPPAVRSVLPFDTKRTGLVLAGLSKPQIISSVRETIEHKEMPALEPGAMSFMMSKHMYLGDTQGHYHPHLMFYSPKSDGTDWGANLQGSPVLLDPLSLSANSPDPFNIFVVPVWKWSDGTAAPLNDH